VRLSHTGVSLVELLVATTLAGFLALLTAGVMTGSRARLEDRKMRLASEQALRAGATAIRTLLQDGEAAGPDLQTAAPSGFMARAIRGSSVLCSVESGLVVARRGDWWSAVREPVAGRDSLALGTLTAGWVLDALHGVPVPTLCPDGSGGLGLPVGLDPGILATLGPGSPVRFFELVELRGYSSSGSDWIGVRQVATGESVQPLAGPLARPGLSLGYLRADGGPAGSSSEIVSVVFQVRVLTPDGRPDSLAQTVFLAGGIR